MDASYKIQRGIHVHLIQFFMCPEFWVHITALADLQAKKTKAEKEKPSKRARNKQKMQEEAR